MEPKYARLTPELYSYVCHHASRANNPVLATLRAETEALGDISRMLISKEQGDFMSLLVAEKSGFQLTDNGDVPALKEFADRMTQQVMDALKEAAPVPPDARGKVVKANGA